MQGINKKIIWKGIIESARPFSITVETFKAPLQGELLISCKEDNINDWVLRFDYGGSSHSVIIGIFPLLTWKLARDKAKAALDMASKGIELYDENQREVWANEKKFCDYIQIFKESSSECNVMALSFLDKVSKLVGSLPFAAITEKVFSFCMKWANNDEEGKQIYIALSSFFYFLIENKKGIASDLDCTEIKKILDNLGEDKTETCLSICFGELYSKILKMVEEKRAKLKYRNKTALFILHLLPYLAVDPELVLVMKWKDINWKDCIWKISLEDNNFLFVPLSHQAIDILTSYKNIKGCDNDYVFYNIDEDNKYSLVSRASLARTLSGMGFTPKEITIRGFKMYAKRYLLESYAYNSDVVTLQMNESVPNKEIYKMGPEAFLEERRKMMQDLADHLDELKKDRDSNAPMEENCPPNRA